MDWASRRIRIRATLALAGVIAIAVTFGSCMFGGHSESQAERVVRHFTDLLDNGDGAAAARLTSYPAAAEPVITQMFAGLGKNAVDYKLTQFIDLDPTDAFFTMDVAWHFAAGQDWSYQVQGKARKLATGWKVSWDPTVLMPGLEHGRTVRLVKAYGKPAKVLDIGGGLLMTEQNVNHVRFDPARTKDRAASANAISRAIAPVAPLITEQSLLADLDAAHGKPITAVTLRDGDFAILGPALTVIPGVVVDAAPALISANRQIDSPLLDAVRGVWQRNRDATAGWAVQLFEPNGMPSGPPAAGYQPPAGPDLKSTLDPRLQIAASEAAAWVATPATIVAIQPSSGAILAVAQNTYADAHGPVALTGLHAAGHTLDLFAGGTATTKKIRLQDVPTQALMNTVGKLGIGTDLEVPGMDTVTGVVPGARLIEPIRMTPNSSGVQVSTFGMAEAAATIAHGTMPMPMFTFWRPATTHTRVEPLKAPVLTRLRQLLREHPFPGVDGYTANAGDDQWFIGTRGDVAFAIHVTAPDTDNAATAMATRFFAAVK